MIVLLCLLCVLPQAAGAAGGKLEKLWVSVTPVEDGAEMPAGSVAWYSANKTSYLFLPGGTDWEETRIWFQGVDTVEIGGVSYSSGDRIADLFDGAELTVQAGKKKTAVHVMQGSALGALFIGTQTGSMKKIDASVDVKEPGTLCLLRPDGTINYDGALTYVKTRGNTAPSMPKKNYGIKLVNGVDLLGMGKAKRWVLVGAYRDHSLLRTQVVFDLARYVGLPYTPDGVQVDVYFNHEYNGTYLLCEKVEINQHRVDVASLEDANKEANPQPVSSYPMVGSKKTVKGKYKAYALEHDPEDITGGYLIEYENWRLRYNYEPSAYTTDKGKVLVIKDPEYASEAEMKYISAFMQGYENAIFAADGVDPKSHKRYDEFVDFESLVLKYMLEEVSMNVDANASSQYYVKPSDSESKVAFAGPCWDYDMSFAAFSSRAYENQFLNTDSLLHIITSSGDYWWGQLYKKPEFKEGVREAWSTKYLPALRILLGEAEDPQGQLLSLEQYSDAVEQSAAMNFTRWPMLTSYGPKNTRRTGLTFEENISFLTRTIRARRDYLDSKWGGYTPAPTQAPAAAAEPKTPEVTAPPAETSVTVPEPTEAPALAAVSGLQPLPMDDYTAFGPAPDESCFTEGKHAFSNENTFDESTYRDESIEVYAWREWRGDCCYNAARIRISDPSQLRTALAENKIWRNHYVWVTAQRNNAVVATGGEWLDSNKNTYTVRMGVTLRKKGYKTRDTLVTDQAGNFHLFKGYTHAQRQALEAEGIQIINLFNFGPALIIDGEVQYEEGTKWKYPVGYTTALQPRTAIGQIGPLEYLMVVTDGRLARAPLPDGGVKLARGCNVATLAKYMQDYGCVQAYALDGGGSAAMYYHGDKFSHPIEKRGVTDIIYFATLVDSGASNP